MEFEFEFEFEFGFVSELKLDGDGELLVLVSETVSSSRMAIDIAWASKVACRSLESVGLGKS